MFFLSFSRIIVTCRPSLLKRNFNEVKVMLRFFFTNEFVIYRCIACIYNFACSYYLMACGVLCNVAKCIQVQKSQQCVTIFVNKSCRWELRREYLFLSLKYRSNYEIAKINRVKLGVRVMVFNATFNNISAISLRPVLLVEETGGDHRTVSSQTNFIT